METSDQIANSLKKAVEAVIYAVNEGDINEAIARLECISNFTNHMTESNLGALCEFAGDGAESA
jgi:hypothetical protein